MIDVSIPEAWASFVSSNFNRVFINPASGCRANCVYCYIFDYGHPQIPCLFGASGGEVKRWLLSQARFREGKSGTLISIGSSCDPFDREVIPKTLELIEALSPLRNPIQLSTKCYVDETAAEQLGKCQTAPGQIVLYATVTSFRSWSRIEPAAHEPHRRLSGLMNAGKQGISTCLYIKPVLPSIMEDETSFFAQALEEYDIPYCTLGLIYTSTKMVSRMKERGLPIEGFGKVNTVRRPPPPSKERETQRYTLVTEILDIIRQIKPNMEAAGAECAISTPCVTALAYDVMCPTGIWRSLPDLCVQCRVNCPSKFAGAPEQVRDIFRANLARQEKGAFEHD